MSVGEKSHHDYDHEMVRIFFIENRWLHFLLFFTCALFISSPEWMDKCACARMRHIGEEKEPTGCPAGGEKKVELVRFSSLVRSPLVEGALRVETGSKQ